MNSKRIILLCIFLFLSLKIYSNDIILNRRKKYPFGANIMILGPGGHIGTSVDAFLFNKLKFEIGLGLENKNGAFNTNYFLGGQYHFFGKTWSNATFYVGIFDAVNFSTSNTLHHLYLPIGYNRIKKNHLSWSIEIAFQPDKAYFDDSMIWGAFKVGYRFGFNQKKKKTGLKDFFNKEK
jgi:hypothetical protein